ncbi:FAD binding domain protein [Verrucomicrobiia bacterium DG1235]|nr:FAD binding domain protein [Verrucomicrobiae bacterium DG1235]
MTTNTNWAGNLAYHSQQSLIPDTLDQAQEIVAQATAIKTIGTRHCFNDIADTEGTHISLAKLNQVISLDETNHTVTVEGGIRYGELGAYLHQRGYALPNLASLPHISVAGAIATATHGSGVKNGNLATSVNAIELLTANGTLHQYNRNKNMDTFTGAIVNLGALGAVTKITLDIQPTYQVRQDLYCDLPLSTLSDHLDEVLSYAYSVSLFTDWKSDSFHQVWLKIRLDQTPDFIPPATLFGAIPAPQNLHPLPGHAAENCTEQLGQPGPWHERLPHFKLDFTPSSGAELQTEYFIPRTLAYPALEALFTLRQKIEPLVFVTELRSVAADDLWLSPCYKRDNLAIHFTWKPDQPAIEKLLPQIEAALAPFQPRTHWGKLHTMSPNKIASSYYRFADFKILARTLDPNGKFRNPYLKRLLA